MKILDKCTGEVAGSTPVSCARNKKFRRIFGIFCFKLNCEPTAQAQVMALVLLLAPAQVLVPEQVLAQELARLSPPALELALGLAPPLLLVQVQAPVRVRGQEKDLVQA